MVPQAVNVNRHRVTHRESSQFSPWKRCDVSCTKSPFEVAQLEGICYSEWLLYLIYIYHLPSFSIIEVITISDISMEMGLMYTIEIYDAVILSGNPTWRAGISTIFQYGEFSHWTIDFGDVPAFLPGTTATSSNMRPGGTNQGASAKKPSSRHSIKCGKPQHLECADSCPKVHSGCSTSMIQSLN